MFDGSTSTKTMVITNMHELMCIYMHNMHELRLRSCSLHRRLTGIVLHVSHGEDPPAIPQNVDWNNLRNAHDLSLHSCFLQSRTRLLPG